MASSSVEHKGNANLVVVRTFGIESAGVRESLFGSSVNLGDNSYKKCNEHFLDLVLKSICHSSCTFSV